MAASKQRIQMATSNQQPITEQSNPLSANIDIAQPLDMVSILERCDKEIFEGWDNLPGLFDERIQTNLSKIVKIAVNILKDASKSAIVISGCGTSGRLGFITTRTFNARLREQGVQECYQYIMGGGDKGLFMSQESVEDDPVHGIKLLEKATEGKYRVLFIGITCGLSAPFVAGQVDYCLQNLGRFTPVLIGFNPSHLARNLPLENWNKTFLQVIRDLEAAESRDQGYLLNPVIGPEPVTGSSRMKGGTATKLLLEAIFVPAHSLCFQNSSQIREYLEIYRHVWGVVYQQKSSIADLLKQAGVSLQDGGSLYYLATTSHGIMGLIDASECPPTFGASFDDVRGFLEGGYSILRNAEGDLSDQGRHHKISTEDFLQFVLPAVKEKDLVVFICKEKASMLNRKIHEARYKKACIIVSTDTAAVPREENMVFDVAVHFDLSPLSTIPVLAAGALWPQVGPLCSELAIKWTLNAVSTGAHIMKGKVCGNIMIDLKVSNTKLFHRAVSIIQHFSQLPAEVCRGYLLRSLYNTDTLTEDIQGAHIAHHILIGAKRERVVPTALLAAVSGCDIAAAKRALQDQPVVRQAVLTSLQRQSQVQVTPKV